MKKQLITLTLAILGYTATAQVPNYVPTNGLVGWWPFNGNANDESGNGNNGTVNGATLTADRFGNTNQAYTFDGVDDFISVNNSPFVQGPFSLSGWVYCYNCSSFFNPIVGFGELGGQNSKRLYIASSFAQIGTEGMNEISAATSFSVSNGWHQWVIVLNAYDVNSVSFYCDGVLLTGNTTTGANIPFPLNNVGFTFGRHTGGSTISYANAIFDDIGIWNRALTTCEIQDLYNAELNSLAVSGGPDQELCEGQSTSLFGTGANTYQWSNNVQNGVGFVPTATNTYVVTGTDANGCIGTDSVMVTVNDHTFSSQTQTALDSYTWPVNGQTYTQSGTFTYTLTNAAGCDSVVTLDLTLSFTGIDEIHSNASKKLLKITDLNGKETPFRKNTVLLFIYEDGTVERVFVTE